MKKLFVGLSLLLAFSANASYFEDNCSDADGNMRWEEGHNNNEISFKHWDEASGDQKITKFDVGQVKIKLLKKKTILKKSTSGECWVGASHYYSAHATITPTAEIKEQFKKIYKSGVAKDYVICHDRWDGETDCRR